MTIKDSFDTAGVITTAGTLGRKAYVPDRDATIVAYDTFGVRAAARVWWTLRVMGYQNAFVLDGGLHAWRADNRPVEAGEVIPEPTTVTPAFDAAAPISSMLAAATLAMVATSSSRAKRPEGMENPSPVS